MVAKVQRWGNSLAVRIPKAFAESAGLSEDSPVQISLVEGDLVVSALPSKPFTLPGLLAGITQENMHAEIQTGPAVGAEVW